MSTILIQLEDGRTAALPLATSTRTGYRLVGRTTPDRFTNKDLTDPSNNLGVQAATPYTVSMDPAFRAKFTTIQAAIDAAAANPGHKTVLISAGNYEEVINLATGVDLVGSGAVSVMGINSSVDNDAITISHLFTTAISITGTAKITFSNCEFHGFGPILVENPAAVVEFSRCMLDAAGDVLHAKAQITFSHSFVGNNVAGKAILCSGLAKFHHSVVRCRVVAGSITARYTQFSGGNEPRIELLGGSTSTLSHCTLDSPQSPLPAIGGGGTIIESHCSFTGRLGAEQSVIFLRDSGEYSPVVTPIMGMSTFTNMLPAAYFTRVGDVVTVHFTFSFLGAKSSIPMCEIGLPIPLRRPFIAASDVIGNAALTYTTTSNLAQISTRVGGFCAILTGIPTGKAETATVSGSFSYILR